MNNIQITENSTLPKNNSDVWVTLSLFSCCSIVLFLIYSISLVPCDLQDAMQHHWSPYTSQPLSPVLARLTGRHCHVNCHQIFPKHVPLPKYLAYLQPVSQSNCNYHIYISKSYSLLLVVESLIMLEESI